MDFELTDEQQLIRESVGKLCSNYPDEYWAQKDKDHEFPWDFYNAMAEAGWLRARQVFSWTNIARETKALYETLLD